MEDVLELYAEPYDPARPVVCFDEASKELRGEVAPPVPPAPGSPAKRDYEYTRHGAANIFVIVEPRAGRRHVTVTDRRATPDFAAQMKYLCDELYPEAEVIRVVLDNLNTHALGSLLATYPPDEAWRLARRLEFHHTPKHASWLNMAECELSVLSRRCLDRRLASRAAVVAEVGPWEEQRNRAGVRLVWSFRVADARRKLAHLYQQNPLR
jgi:DDE superfamily endonuclease